MRLWHILAVGLSLWNAAVAADLLWFDGGRPNDAARQAVAILGAAGSEGLDAASYDAYGLRHAVAAAEKGPGLPADTVALLDGALTDAMRRFLSDLHFGRIDPREIQENFSSPAANGFEPLTYLRAAVAGQRLPEAAAMAAPASPHYARLRQALARYRQMSGGPLGDAPWRTALPSPPGGKLEPGQSYAGMSTLTKRLIVLGDLPQGTPTPARYEGAVVSGMKAFQSRHGMTADGVIGQGSFERLSVPPAARARQIELAMERLRWTPLMREPRMIVVNIPEFMLEGYEMRDGNVDIRTRMKVIVGKARETPTPIFDEEMRFIEFSPFWNVPPSIARAETLPRLRRDPGYFGRQGFEFVAADGSVSRTLSPEALDAVQRGQARIRQRPGAANALGDIKFVFPNKDNIYLHHTPTPRLFKRDRRDFSHGCIRVDAPVALAKFVLQNDPEWTEERIRQAMTRGTSATLRLRAPLRVVIAYSTVAVGGDGLVHFFPDIYGQDKLLDDALRRSVQEASLARQKRA